MVDVLRSDFGGKFKNDEESKRPQPIEFLTEADPQRDLDPLSHRYDDNQEYLSALVEGQLQITQSSGPDKFMQEKTSNINTNIMRGRDKSRLDDFFKVKESSLKPE